MEDRQIELAKRLLESKGYNVTKKRIYEFSEIDEDDIVSLNEFFDINGNDYAWEESLEEALYESQLEGDQLKEYEVGDIIMPTRYRSSLSGSDVDPHRILIISSKKKGNDGIIEYRGFALSSRVEKANKNNPKYPNNIYIQDYSSILYRGKSLKKEAIIRVDDIVSFTNEDLDTRGVWKGKASFKFMRFIDNCYKNYKNGGDNSKKRWYSSNNNR